MSPRSIQAPSDETQGRSIGSKALIGTILVVLALASGCGLSGPDLEPVTIQLNWYHEAEFVGYYMALEQGFYEEEGLAVDILEGGPGIQARLAVLDGSAEFAVSSFAEQRQLLDEGKPVIAVGSVFQIPPLVMFSLKSSGIREPADMVGKRIGIKNEYWREIARETLANAGISPDEVIEVDVETEAKTLLYDGEVDVWMGYVHDEPIEAEVTGHPVTNVYPANYGVGGYEGLLLTNEATAEERAELVEGFVRASYRGWHYAVEHPAEAAAIMTRWQPENTLEFQEMAVRALVPLVDVPQAGIGWIDADRWQRLMEDSYRAERPGFTMQFLREVE